LIYAVKSNSYELVRFLLTIPELNIYKADDEGWTALHWAVMKGNSDIVDAILGHHECSINSQNDVSTPQLEKFSCLIFSNDLQASRTPLHIAAMTGTVNIARILLAHPKIKVQLKDKVIIDDSC
jgi:ankyrin repeat protein